MLKIRVEANRPHMPVSMRKRKISSQIHGNLAHRRTSSYNGMQSTSASTLSVLQTSSQLRDTSDASVKTVLLGMCGCHLAVLRARKTDPEIANHTVCSKPFVRRQAPVMTLIDTDTDQVMPMILDREWHTVYATP